MPLQDLDLGSGCASGCRVVAAVRGETETSQQATLAMDDHTKAHNVFHRMDLLRAICTGAGFGTLAPLSVGLN